MPRRAILRSIFFPSEKVDPKYETMVLTLSDGQRLLGLLVSEDGNTIVMKTADAGDPVTLRKAQVKSRTREKASIMPDDLADRVTDDGVRDVAAYVMRTIQ